MGSFHIGHGNLDLQTTSADDVDAFSLEVKEVIAVVITRPKLILKQLPRRSLYIFGAEKNCPKIGAIMSLPLVRWYFWHGHVDSACEKQQAEGLRELTAA